jgi:opacity protein-like surface antigen
MMKRLMFGVATVAALSLAAAPAHAQAPHFGISAGASVPTGDFKDAADNGFNLNGLVDIGLPMAPIGFRGEVGWNQFDIKGGTNDKWRIFNGTANVVLTPSTIMPAKPYLIAGIGAYNVRASGENIDLLFGESQSETRVGFNGGVGFKAGLGGLGAFLEARYVSISGKNGDSALNYVPVTFGITF